MAAPAQRVKIELERVSPVSDYDEEGYEECWLVVATLDLDTHKRQRATLRRCATHDEAAAALDGIWEKLIAERASGERAA